MAKLFCHCSFDFHFLKDVEHFVTCLLVICITSFSVSLFLKSLWALYSDAGRLRRWRVMSICITSLDEHVCKSFAHFNPLHIPSSY